MNYERLVNTNSKILEYGEYNNICYILDYLRDEVKIDPENIEKCPSILYLAVQNIRSNYEFLKKEKISNYSVEGCLHILSTEPAELRKTYQYIIQNYGVRYLNAKTTILRVPVSRIQDIEIKFPDLKKKNVLQAASSKFSIAEIEKIVKVCKANGMEPTGSIFRKTAEEIEPIIKVCKANGIEPTGNIFLKPAEEIEKIVEVCKTNGIEVTGSVFLRSAKQLQENIDYILKNYGKEYLTPVIISKNLKNLKNVMPYLQEKGVLQVVQKSAPILTLTLDEIKERQNFIKSIGESIVSQDGTKFNSIFGLSKKMYAKRVEKEKNRGEELE